MLFLMYMALHLIAGGSCVETVYFKKGSTATIKCRYRSTTAPLVWRGPPDLSFLSENNFVLNSSKLTVINTHQGVYDLRIRNFSVENLGIYQCSTAFSELAVQQEITPMFAEAPKAVTVTNQTVDGTVVFTEGLNVSLECVSDRGVPKGKIMWTHGGKVLSTTNYSDVGTFYFKTYRADHLKLFTCIVDNMFYVMQRQAQLFLHLVPMVKVYPEKTQLIDEGENVTLSCRSEKSHSQLDFFWITKGKILQASSGPEDLHLVNLTKENSGTYTCEVTNQIGKGRNSIDLIIRYKPYLQGHASVLHFEAVINKPTVIVVYPNSLSKPNVRWTNGSGGTVGSWHIRTGQNNTFIVFSTITVQSRQHIGKYGLEVSNEIGCHYIGIELHPFSSTANVSPSVQSFNTTSSIDLQCSVLSVLALRNVWFHVKNGTVLRMRQRKISGYTSILQIKNCSYEDTGQYICIWSSNTHAFAASSDITVKDRPRFSKKIVTEDNGLLRVSLMFYSVPDPTSVRWLQNGEITKDGFKTSLLTTEVLVLFHNKLLRTNGFVSELIFPIRFINRTYRCQVWNSFGTLDVTYERDLLEGALLTTNVISSCFLSLISDGICNHQTEYIIGGSTVILTIVVALSVLVRSIITRRVKTSNVRTVSADQDNLRRSDTMLEVDHLPDHGYEQIEDISNDIVQNRNSSESSTQSAELMVIAPYENFPSINSYEDLGQRTLHEYETCYV